MEARVKLDPRVFDPNCSCKSDSCAVCEGVVKPEDIADISEVPAASWHDPYSWIPSPTVVREPEPGSLDYLRLGCDELYTELGGES